MLTNRSLVIRSAGLTRTETYKDREHIVVPVVALLEGVVHAMNAKTAEFVSSDELRTAGWDGRPVFLNHPMVKGRPVSGNNPTILEEKCIGTVFNTAMKKGKLTMEAWLDKERTQEIAPTLLTRIEQLEPIEISVGVFVETDDSTGEYDGKKYAGAWHDIVPDHLALLDEAQEGACSREMGCGVRAAGNGSNQYQSKGSAYHVIEHTDDGGVITHGVHTSHAAAIKQGKKLRKEGHAATYVLPAAFAPRAATNNSGGTMADGKVKETNAFTRMIEAAAGLFRAAQPAGEMSSSDLTTKLSDALRKQKGYNFYYLETYYPVVDPNRVVYYCSMPPDPFVSSTPYSQTLLEQAFTLGANGEVELSGTDVEVERVVSYRPLAMNIDPEDDVTAAAGKRHSAKDESMIQDMHDHSVALGAACDKSSLENLIGNGNNQYKHDGDLTNVTIGAKVHHPESGAKGKVTAIHHTQFGPLAAINGNNQTAYSVFSLKVATASSADEGSRNATACACKKNAEGAPCSCGGNAPAVLNSTNKESDMNKEQITKFLETATPEQLTALSAVAENKPVAAAPAAVAAEPTVAAAPGVAAAAPIKPVTFEDVLASAPADVRESINEGVRVASARKTTTIKGLMDTGRCKYTEDELKAMSQRSLDILVELAGSNVRAAIDFSGQGTPKETSVPTEAPAAPSLLTALQGKK
jgi:hypothetical protein